MALTLSGAPSSLALQAKAALQTQTSGPSAPPRSRQHCCNVSRCGCVAAAEVDGGRQRRHSPPRAIQTARGQSPQRAGSAASPVPVSSPATCLRSPRQSTRKAGPAAAAAQGRRMPAGEEARADVRCKSPPQPAAENAPVHLGQKAAELPLPKRGKPVVPPLSLSFEADSAAGLEAAVAAAAMPQTPVGGAAAVATPASSTTACRSPNSLTESALRKTQELLAQFSNLELDLDDNDVSTASEGHKDTESLWDAVESFSSASSSCSDSSTRRPGTVQVPLALLEMMSAMYWQLRDRQQRDQIEAGFMLDSDSGSIELPTTFRRKASCSRLSVASTASGASTATLSPRPNSEFSMTPGLSKSDTALIRELRTVLAQLGNGSESNVRRDISQALSAASSSAPTSMQLPALPIDTSARCLRTGSTCTPYSSRSDSQSPVTFSFSSPMASTRTIPATPVQIVTTPAVTVLPSRQVSSAYGLMSPAPIKKPTVVTTVTHTVTTVTSVYA
eukprot:TRINITY_DN3577_c0_g1_i1.p1 TRINITY_DN3577_c0_g1~~TRINITY_DN3577_c0_g1_i1.p1  ORF type:complete len:503 (-),score=99.09 TRINITY_DN3577_c0_g1_i1:229-1737(-)